MAGTYHEPRRVHINPGGIVAGLALIGVGAAALLDQAGVAQAGTIISSWWPVLVIAAGLGQVLSRPRGGGGVTLVAGVVLLALTTGLITGAAMSYVWPVLLVGAGIWIMLSRGAVRPTAGDPTSDIRAWALFSGRNLVSAAQPLRSGALTAVFGGVDADLTGADLPPDGATIDVTAAFGGVTIIAPPGWRIDMSGPAIFGGYEDKTSGPRPGGPVLHVRCLVLFGGAEVKTGAVPAPPAADALAEAS